VPVPRHVILAEQATNASAAIVAYLRNLYYHKDLSLTMGSVWVDSFYLDVAQLA